MEGQGATYAAYEIAINLELHRFRKEDFGGGAADIFKCLDQINRPLVYKLLKEARLLGMVLTAYKSFQDSFKVRNTIAGVIGKEYKKISSIPQGGPLSMVITSLLLRSWIVQTKSIAAKPRILADDLQIIASGTRHMELFEPAFDTTHERLGDLGAKVAQKKPMVFSSEVVARKWLSEHKWRRLGKAVTVLNDCRDLGAHLNATQRWRSTT